MHLRGNLVSVTCYEFRTSCNTSCNGIWTCGTVSILQSDQYLEGEHVRRRIRKLRKVQEHSLVICLVLLPTILAITIHFSITTSFKNTQHFSQCNFFIITPYKWSAMVGLIRYLPTRGTEFLVLFILSFCNSTWFRRIFDVCWKRVEPKVHIQTNTRRERNESLTEKKVKDLFRRRCLLLGPFFCVLWPICVAMTPSSTQKNWILYTLQTNNSVNFFAKSEAIGRGKQSQEYY